jgi:hypothetical protein
LIESHSGQNVGAALTNVGWLFFCLNCDFGVMIIGIFLINEIKKIIIKIRVQKKSCIFAGNLITKNMETKERTMYKKGNRCQGVVRKSKAALAMEYYKDNPPIRILDMRAVLK